MSLDTRPPRTRLFALILFFPLYATAVGQTSATVRSVEDLLQDLRRSGVEVIFSSDLVPPDILAPPARAGASPMQLAIDALAANGLELRPIGSNAYVVAQIAKPVVTDSHDSEAPLDEVSVYASRYAIDVGLAEPHELPISDIALLPGTHDDSLRALRSLPGLASNASARPYIRGSLSEDVLVRFDGVTLVDPFHFKNFQSLISAVDPAAIDRIEVFSGGFPVRYGTRSGGVIDIRAPSQQPGYEYRANLSLISAGLSSSGQTERWPLEWLAAVRGSTLDKLEPVQESFGTPEFSDSLGRLRWATERGAWTLGWLLLDDRLALGAEDDEEAAVARYRDEYVWIARDHQFSDALRMRASVVVTSAERNRRGTLYRPGVAAGGLEETRDFSGLEFANSWTLKRGDHSTYTFGAEWASTRTEYQYSRHSDFAPELAAAFGRPRSEDIQFEGSPNVESFAVYAANRHKWNRFETELGVRLDEQRYKVGGNDSQFSPRLNLRYDLSDRLRMYGSVGRFTQAQHVEEWRIEEGQELPDSAQTAIHSIIGLEYAKDAETRLGIEVYSKRWTTVAPYYDDQFDPFALLPELSPDRVRVAPHASEASGVEISVRGPISREVTGWGAFTWSRVVDEFQGEDTPRSWDQPYALTAGLAWQGSRANVSALASWHRGWPRTRFENAAEAGNVGTALNLESRNSGRWGDYYSLDLRGSWTWTLGSGELSAVLDLTNSTNRNNECCVVFARSGATQQLEPEIDHWFPIIINMGFTFRWRHTPQ